jgi:TonB family protein
MNALLSSSMLSWLLSYLFNALWQIPLIFAAAWIASRMLRRSHPRIGHRVWVGALLLQVALPACSLHISTLITWLASWVSSWISWTQGSAVNGQVRVLLGAGEAGGSSLHLSPVLLAGITLLYACTVLYFAGRLLWGLLQTRALARSAIRLTLTGDAALHWTQHCHRIGITAPSPEIAASPQGIGPVTVGLRRGLLLLPPALLEAIAPGDLDAVLAHELAHIQRRDFAKNLLYGLVLLPVAWHPVVWWTRARVAESRELVCDAIAAEAVAAGGSSGHKQYAQSLLRLASVLSVGPRAATLHALGILSFNQDANALERRIMTLTRKPAQMSTAHRIAIAAACSVLALATCTSALALHMDVSELATDAQQSAPQKIHVSAKEMSGNRISGNNPTYPPEEREKKVQGTVVLDATVSKVGVIENLRVVKSPAESLSQSALDAVRTWRYRPYLLNGEPVAVQTTVNVTFCLEPCKLPPGEWHRVP